MVTPEQSVRIANAVYDDVFPERYEQLFQASETSKALVSDSGLLTVVTEQRVTLGFGILRELTPSFDLLAAIESWNQKNLLGHYWLVAGSDNNHWSLVCGFKYVPNWESPESLTVKLSNVAEAYSVLLEAYAGQAEKFGGRNYWSVANDTSIGALGLVLMSHLS
mgnify:FL=1